MIYFANVIEGGRYKVKVLDDYPMIADNDYAQVKLTVANVSFYDASTNTTHTSLTGTSYISVYNANTEEDPEWCYQLEIWDNVNQQWDIYPLNNHDILVFTVLPFEEPLHDSWYEDYLDCVDLDVDVVAIPSDAEIKVNFYKVQDDDRKVTKTLNHILYAHGSLRKECSIVNPILEVEANADILEANYCKVLEFNNRFYYIIDITCVRAGLYRVSLKVDVLMSYSSEIRSLTAYVTRNENTFDPLIEDTLLPMRYVKQVAISEITNDPNTTYVNTTFSVDTLKARNVVVTLYQPEFATSGTPADDYDSMLTGIDANEIPVIDTRLPKIRNVNFYTPVLFMLAMTGQMREYDSGINKYYTSPLLEIVLKAVSDDTFASKIASIIAFPFTVTENHKTLNMYVKYGSGGSDYISQTRLDDLSLHKTYKNQYQLLSNISKKLVINDFIFESAPSNFTDVEPYKITELYLPYYGFIKLPRTGNLGDRILIYYVVNYQDGHATVNVYNEDKKVMIFNGQCKLGVEIPVNTTNLREITNQRNALNISTAFGILTSALALGTGLGTGHTIAGLGGAIGIGQTIAHGVTTNAQIYERANVGSTGTNIAVEDPQKAYIKTTTVYITDTTSNFASVHGRPLNQSKSLSTLTGFTVVGQVVYSGMGSITKPELDEIDTYLKNGVIL